MRVEISNHSKIKAPKSYLLQAIDFFEGYLKSKKVVTAKIKTYSLQLAFVDKKQGRKLNEDFRGKKYATDVLSFSPVEDSSLGELVLCAEVVRDQAKQHKLSFRDESVYLVFHGILHLLGFDHEDGDIEAEKMFKLQDSAFERFLRRDSQ